MAAKKTTTRTNALPMLKESAHDIWLAGLGAFGMAGDEGSKMFKELVKRGKSIETTNKSRIGKLADRAQSLGGTAVAKVKRPFETGMDNAMHMIGAPTRKEIASLSKRVEELTRVVSRKTGVKKTSRAKKKTGTASA